LFYDHIVIKFLTKLYDYRGVHTKNNATSTSQWYEPTTLERSRGASLSSLNELDFHSNAIEEKVSRLFKLGAVHKTRSQSAGVCPVRTFSNKGGFSDADVRTL